MAVLDADAIRSGPQLRSGEPLGVRQERVLPHTAGQQSLGAPEDEHQVEVDAEDVGEPPHQHHLPEAPDAREVGVELELERPLQRVERRPVVDGVERRDALQRRIDALRRRALRGRPAAALVLAAELAPYEAAHRSDEVLPRGAGCRVVESGAEACDERRQLFGVRRVAFPPLDEPPPRVLDAPFACHLVATVTGVTGQSLLPAVPTAHDHGLPADPLPAPGRDRRPVLRADRVRRRRGP